MKSLYVSLSGHGYGHGAMTAAVVNRLRERVPDLRLTIATSLPEAWLKTRFRGNFSYLETTGDFGLVMKSPNEVDAQASAEAYAALHENWGEVVAGERMRIAAAAPDLVLSNISTIALAGAQGEGVPAVALGPFTWADMVRCYCASHPMAGTILGHMEAAHAHASLFLKPEPSLPGGTPIGPIGAIGRSVETDLRALLGLGPEKRLGLIAMGGIDGGADPALWPAFPGWHWIYGHQTSVERPDMTLASSLPHAFSDLMQSVAVIVTKPGYGTFVEAGCGGVPVLTAERQDWPETPTLMDWLRRHTPCLALPQERLFAGDIGEALKALETMERPPPAKPTGIEEAAALIQALLSPPTPGPAS